MGLRGPAAKPTAIRNLEGTKKPGMFGSVNEPRYAAIEPERPKLSPAARKIWDRLIQEMRNSGVLRPVDWMALGSLCEDQATLDELRSQLAAVTTHLKKQAKENGKVIVGGPLVQMAQTASGRRIISVIRELTTSLIVQRREFGLTPASNSRIEAFGAGGAPLTEIEDQLCGVEGVDYNVPNQRSVM